MTKFVLDNFDDHRGKYIEIWNSTRTPSRIIWKQDCASVSYKNVLRGLHGDHRGCWKLVTCLFGTILVAEADPLTSQSWTMIMSTGDQILVEPDQALGHLVLSDTAVFHYKQSQLYDPSAQFTIKWNDPKYGIKWPITDPILSERDSA